MMIGGNHSRQMLLNARKMFSIHEMIGSGSFSNVYRATSKQTHKDVALKVFKRKTNDVNQYARAGMEMAFMKMLNHPNIISFKVCELSRESIYLGIEYSPFGTLATLILQKEYLSENYLKIIMRQLALAIDYLHGKSICHGDIKPDNIIVCNLNGNPIIKLSDFGLAEVFDEGERHSRKGGSFFYMAPELHLKFPYDLSIDIFSTGILMYELIFKKLPFIKGASKNYHIAFLRKRTKLVTCADLLTRPGPPLSQSCTQLLEQLLEYDKHQRPTGAALKNHPFLNTVQTFVDPQNHYIKGCACMVRSFELRKAKELGDAFIEANEGILHLRIHSVFIKDDVGMFSYVLKCITDYITYSKQLEDELDNESFTAPVTLSVNNERLRCMLTSSPNMLMGYDICCVGEMYLLQNKSDLGRQKLSEGLEILLRNMDKEPTGDRRHYLLAKIEEWIGVLENKNTKTNVI